MRSYAWSCAVSNRVWSMLKFRDYCLEIPGSRNVSLGDFGHFRLIQVIFWVYKWIYFCETFPCKIWNIYNISDCDCYQYQRPCYYLVSI